jgi:glucokinase
MGTGIGCGIVLGGNLLIGAHGMAGEAGHAVVSGDAPCGCGGIGHAETLAAADGTMARASAEGCLPDDFRGLWALRGTHSADAVLNVTIDAMARAAASVCHMLDPQMIVIGGGMSQAPGIVEAIAERTVPYLSRPFKHTLDLRQSQLGNTAALYGAASLYAKSDNLLSLRD